MIVIKGSISKNMHNIPARGMCFMRIPVTIQKFNFKAVSSRPYVDPWAIPGTSPLEDELAQVTKIFDY